MYMRRRARNGLLALGVEPAERMVQGKGEECWGPDIIM